MTSMNVLTLAETTRNLYRSKVKDPTYLNWLKAVGPIAELPIDQVTEDIVRAQRIYWLQKSESTCKLRLSSLKAIWNKARKMKLIPGTKADNPWLDSDDGLVIASRDPEFYPWEHYARYHKDPYFVILWFTGARIGEVAGLSAENIVIDAEIPYFQFINQENRDVKNNPSKRKVPMHPACLPVLPHFRQSKAIAPGKSWSENFGKNMQLPLGDAAHTLRHSFHTRCRDAGIEEYMIDILTGHAKASTTAQYGKTRLHLLEAAILKLR
jgi:integrase